jgi:nucleoside-diphosphate-sugar epimerase
LTGSFVVDSTSARDTLGFVPPQPLADGLREAAEWWRAGRPHVWP